MRILFAGPSIYGSNPNLAGITLRPPASHGDVTAAVLEGATAIGLVDGQFETMAAVWHKEILFALSRGVHVLGGASMGALRAAECHQFGMEPVGEIAHQYISGELDDDAAVAQVHAPAELGFAPLTETLVDAEATIRHLEKRREITGREAHALRLAAASLFFKHRTVAGMLAMATGIKQERAACISHRYKAAQVSPKKSDALALIDRLRTVSPDKPMSVSWQFSEPAIWKRSLASTTKGLSIRQ